MDSGQPVGSTVGPIWRATGIWLVLATLVLLCFASALHGQVRKNILLIADEGPAAPGVLVITNLLVEALHSDPAFRPDVYFENLDAMFHPDEWRKSQADFIVKKYSDRKLDLIVLAGPNANRLLAEPSTAFFPGVPIVFCGSVPLPLEHTNPGTPFTGTWIHLEPAGTVDVALRLLPETRSVFVVAGQGYYDQRLTALTKAALKSYENKLEITYLTDLAMDKLLERLRHLPDHSVILFLTLWVDAEGRQLLSTTQALPMVSAAANAPVFGVSDTYIGRGIVGGKLVSFEEQGKIASRDAVEILRGKAPQDIPIVTGPPVYQFDWRELQRWNMEESRLPPGSTVLFRQPTLWEQHKRTVLTVLLVVAFLALLTIYLLFERQQLKQARNAQERLSAMLINSQEVERSRLAAEIHDDFSQRLATLALGLGTAAKTIPETATEANRRLQMLSQEVSTIGGDLHTLSHRLHSSTLESLGLGSGVKAFCKEFAAQQGIKIDFTADHVPRSVNHDVGLCAFRIVQEALRNAKKHGGASSAEVSLQMVDDQIHLIVSDQGVGFDPREAKMKEGLGLRSMEERARLLGGRFSVRSAAGRGTTIEAWLPLEPKSAAWAG